MNKKIMLIFFSIFMLLLFDACDDNTDGDSETEVAADTDNKPAADTTKEPTVATEFDFWHAMSGPHEEALNGFVDQFNQANEHITVKAVNQGSYDDLKQKIMAAAKAQTLPTLAQAVTSIVPEYTANSFIVSLNEFIADPEIGLSDDEVADYVDVFKASSMWDGTYYSLPFSKSTRVLFYNTGLLEAHDLSIPETWDDIRNISEVITGDGVVGMGFENSYESEFQAILKQMGGTYINEETLEATFSSAEGIEAMNLIKGMIDDGIARTAGEDDYMSNPFGRGDVAMYIGSSAGIPHVASAAEGNIEWSTTTLPTYDGQAATTFAGNDIVMFSQSESVKQEATWEFMKFLTSPEITAEWSLLSGYLPVRYSAQEIDSYQQYVAENPEYKAGPDQFDDGFFIARVQGGDAVRNIVLEEFEYILLGSKSVEEGLAEAQERSNQALQ